MQHKKFILFAAEKSYLNSSKKGVSKLAIFELF